MADRTLDLARSKVRRLTREHPGLYPVYTQDGKWRHDGDAWTRWCEGFLPGMMWLFYRLQPERGWRLLAESYSRAIESRKDDRDVHDLGFIFYHGSYKPWYDATVREGQPEARLKEVVLHAGRTLALRFDDRAGCLRSFHGDDSTFIDIMMNVGLIFFTGLETRDPRLLSIATRHVETTIRALVRADGSTAHEAIFDRGAGDLLRESTQQGFAPDSCWARGLAWSLYGFGTCFELTGAAEYLKVAEANAGYWLDHVPDSGPGYGIAPWDFAAPESGPLSRGVIDTSASAIAASGLLQLAVLTTDAERRDRYIRGALGTLLCLMSGYTSEDDEAWEGVLKGGVYHIHKGLGVNESVMWGEFFFVEALARAKSLLDAKSRARQNVPDK